MSKGQTIQQIFLDVFRENRWRNKQSISGPGSTLAATRALREILPKILAQLQIKTLVDAPCGDANWIRHLDYAFDEYIGIDIVPDLVARLQVELASPYRRFGVGDITVDVLPKADAILCRDCLVHIEYDAAIAAIENWRRAGFIYALVTTYPGIENRDILTGRWRPLNMEAAPFNFPAPLSLIDEGRPPKSIGIWHVDDLLRAPGAVSTSKAGGPVATAAPLTSSDSPASPPKRTQRPPVSRDIARTRLSEIENLWAKKKRGRALILAEELYHDAPDNARVANFYGWCLHDRREYLKALEVTVQSFEHFGTAQFLSRLCLIYTDLKRGHDALRVTEEQFSNHELRALALLYHGATLVKMDGRLDPSIDFFHRAAHAGDLKADSTPARLSTVTRSFAAFTEIEDDCARHPITFLGGPAAAAEAVVAVTGDETYFRALFDIYRDSFFANVTSSRHILHAHIFDPSADLREEITALEGRFDGRLRFSFERTDGTNRSYYYIGRFVQTPRLMSRYNCPILVTDLDCYFKDGIDGMLQGTANADLGIVELQKRLCPWRNFLGGFVAFNPSASARRYALGVQNFLLSLPDDTNFWYVDQLALMEANYLSRASGTGRFEVVTDAWRQLFDQGTGTTGEPQAKADRMKKKLAAHSVFSKPQRQNS